MPTLRSILDQRVREADPLLYERLDKNRVRCVSCGHCCPIPDGQPGVCKVRYNQGGTLYVPWGYVAGTQCDPIEKKPFFHAHPGALAYSFGMLGCDLHCGYCQNWVTSQALRDPSAISPPLETSPDVSGSRRHRPGRESPGQHLQRAADHQRMGRRRFQRSESRGTSHRLRFQRQRNAAGPRILAPLARSLQSGPQEFRRSPLPRTRRPHRADSRQHSPHPRDGIVARDRHAAHPRLQRFRG